MTKLGEFLGQLIAARDEFISAHEIEPNTILLAEHIWDDLVADMKNTYYVKTDSKPTPPFRGTITGMNVIIAEIPTFLVVRL